MQDAFPKCPLDSLGDKTKAFLRVVAFQQVCPLLVLEVCLFNLKLTS